MCYSAQIERDWNKYVRIVGPDAALNLEDFIKKYWWRQHEFPSMKIPKAVDAWFTRDGNGDQAKIADMIETFNEKEIAKLEQEMFKQKKRVADAERTLQTKATKKALETISASPRTKSNGRSASWATSSARNSSRRDARMFPGWYVPVIVSENGKRGDEADALPVPPTRQTEVLRHEVPRHLQRAQGQSDGHSGRTYSDTSTASCWRRRSSRT